MGSPERLDELNSFGVTWLAVWYAVVVATLVLTPLLGIFGQRSGASRRQLVLLMVAGAAAIGWAVFYFQTDTTVDGGGHCVIRDRVQTHFPNSFHPLGDCHDAQFMKGLLSVGPMVMVVGAGITLVIRSRLVRSGGNPR